MLLLRYAKRHMYAQFGATYCATLGDYPELFLR